MNVLKYFKVNTRNQLRNRTESSSESYQEEKKSNFLKKKYNFYEYLLNFQVFLWLMFCTIAPGKSQKEDRILSNLNDCMGKESQHIVVPDKFDGIINAKKFLNGSKSITTFTNTSYSRSQAMLVEPSHPVIHSKHV